MKSAVTSIAAPLLVAAVTLIAFAPVLQNGFTNWDDPPSLLYNPNYRGLSWPHLLLVAAVTLIAFAPVLQNGFTNWDDPPSLLYNPNYRGLSWPHLLWMFTTFQNSLYRPLTWMTLGADYLVWGMNPARYHLSALLFHAANAVLFYFVALKLLSTTTAGERNALTVAAATAALLFAVHPLQVEAVAWTQA